MKKLFITLAALLFSQSAIAGPTANLNVQLIEPNAPIVDTAEQYSIRVENLGSAQANSIVLTIDLPITATSPTADVLGVLSNVDSRCTRSVARLTCNLGSLKRNRNTSVNFSLASPYSYGDPQDIVANATTTTSESNLSNNSDTYTPDLSYEEYDLAGTNDMTITSCYGDGLSSFYECELYPSSYSIFEATFTETSPGVGDITFPNLPPEYQGAAFTGNWAQSSNEDLSFEIYDGGILAVQFTGKGVADDCFEGGAYFPDADVTIPYQVCLP